MMINEHVFIRRIVFISPDWVASVSNKAVRVQKKFHGRAIIFLGDCRTQTRRDRGMNKLGSRWDRSAAHASGCRHEGNSAENDPFEALWLRELFGGTGRIRLSFQGHSPVVLQKLPSTRVLVAEGRRSRGYIYALSRGNQATSLVLRFDRAAICAFAIRSRDMFPADFRLDQPSGL
jgi:hypothetical protein